MTRLLVSSAVPSRDSPRSSSKSSTTTSVVAFTPDDGSVIDTSEVDPDIPIPSVEMPSSPPTIASLSSFDASFTWRSQSPIASSVHFTPPRSSITSSNMPSMRVTDITADGTIILENGLRRLRLSGTASATGQSEASSTPGPLTPKTATTRQTSVTGSEISRYALPTPATPSVESGSIAFSRRSTSGVATPRTAATERPTAPDRDSDASPGPFNLLDMQAALGDAAASQSPATPRVRARTNHLSPTPTPAPENSAHRRRRSNSAIRQPRHEVSEEDPPASRFHESEFQQAFRDAKAWMLDLTDVLASGSLHTEPDSTMRKLFEEATELIRFKCPNTRTVGFVGDSGVGKSSLINSLLDIKGLARTSGSGAACTCVVTEYHYSASPGFVIEVEYFQREELEKQISELLESYRHYHLSYDELSDDEERRFFEEKAGVARDTFTAMFRVQLRNNEDFLLETEDEQDVLEQLMSWVDVSPHSTMAKETLADAETCSQRLNELTSDPGSLNAQAMWPFIHRIKVYTNAHILSKGLILVDLPGLRDINSARRRITERYIRNCDEIFAVCNIIRATTDEGVKAVVELANKASLSNVGIICTRSDDIQAEEAKKDWKDQRARRVIGLEHQVNTARGDLALIEEKIEEKINEFDMDVDDMEEEEKHELLQLQLHAKNAREALARRKYELKVYLVSTRNETVLKELKKAYADKIPGGGFSTFCVSNRDYWQNRDKPKDVSMPFLELSGMIEVRRHCISIVDESQLRAARLYMQQRVPALLDSVQLWVQSGSGSLSAERKGAIRATLDEVEGVIRQGLTARDSELGHEPLKRRIREFLSAPQNLDIWVQGAMKAARTWSGWHHSSYSAFCRKYGNHSTPTQGYHNWNEEAIEAMVSSLALAWKDMCKDIENQGHRVTGVLDDICTETTDRLNSDDDMDVGHAEILSKTVESRMAILESELEDLYEEVRKDLARLRTDAFTGIATSFIAREMQRSYEKCQQECGSGSDSRRKAIINRRLGSDDIFIEMQRQLKTRLKDVLKEFKDRQSEVAREHFETIKENLDMLRDDNVILEGENHPEFRNRVEEEVRRVKDAVDGLLARPALAR